MCIRDSIKVEASKFTEVGYVGRDVESMVRELMNNAVNQTRQQMLEEVRANAYLLAVDKVLDLLVPGSSKDQLSRLSKEAVDRKLRTRERMSEKLMAGDLDHRELEFKEENTGMELQPSISLEMYEFDISEMMANIFPGSKKNKRLRMKVGEALDYFTEKEANRMVSRERVLENARNAVENNGIIFIDEIDKIAAVERSGNLDVSRSGVQRDLLPIVEGSHVPTKHGMIDTAHILFIAAGAFNVAKPSDLIPELQGRFPLRVELNSLSQSDFERILLEPENALTKQYQALFAAEGAGLSFAPAAIREIARYAALANEKMEDIGARRLHTIMNTLLDEFLFDLPEAKLNKVNITARLVTARLKPVIESDDLSRFIL